MSSRPDPRSALILASGSRYRRQLLLRIATQVDAIAADIDEAARAEESPGSTAARLARAKAEAVARRYPGRLVVGSDQVAELNGHALGKPGSHLAAIDQLRACGGQEVIFHTSVCVLDGHGGGGDHLDRTMVRFRTLGDDEIERYLAVEQPYDCAGSFKIERLGVCLFEAVHSEDPTALIGLPLIATCRLLRAAGFDPLAP